MTDVNDVNDLNDGVRDRYDLAVIGAGPAGFAAAVTAADAGLAVVILDAGRAAGGQFYRQPAAALRAARPDRLHHGWRAYTAWTGRLAAHVAAGTINHLTDHHVWTVERLDADAADGRGLAGAGSATAETAASPGTLFAVHAVIGAGGATGRAVQASAVLLATGAYERQLPFPGWTLPGVVTAGGAQAQLKDSLVVPGRRVVVAGTGPLLLSVAASLALAGAKVPAVVEAADPLRYARHAKALALNPGKLIEGAGYAATLVRHGIPVRPRHVVVAAHGERRVEAVSIARTDRAGRPVPGRERMITCDALAVGYGLDAQLEIALELGCGTRREPDGGWVLTVDAQQRTGVPGVWAAGETTGVGGAQLALIEGELAAHSIAATLPAGGFAVRAAGASRPGRAMSQTAQPSAGDGGETGSADRVGPVAAAGRSVGSAARPGRKVAKLVRRRARLRAFADVLQQVHTLPERWSDNLRADTAVCRCEEVPYAAVRDAVTDLGATDSRSVKLLTRAGMGWCQGRMCGTAVQCLVGELTGGEAKAAPAARPLACPVPLGVLAEGAFAPAAPASGTSPAPAAAAPPHAERPADPPD
ncbi:FAD/NAD(P)-dependent oxidoreductase [Yinghuangia soli]|uniref:NAD(P)/FAD-dependent oxidoreductase n=1 Tax=Yinghuangia soli TaxID=2908204 RepID=A0AA41Q7P7_9ACTN|nr:NAD(P)/FAD-dependent oxidoreductase [Yinghuangia soli]MCF2531879.1 NAD(P)/FAD-dependent oxidoreductase [Yinghuangia soli]